MGKKTGVGCRQFTREGARARVMLGVTSKRDQVGISARYRVGREARVQHARRVSHKRGSNVGPGPEGFLLLSTHSILGLALDRIPPSAVLS